MGVRIEEWRRYIGSREGRTHANIMKDSVDGIHATVLGE
jgi:hypothetical protein